jgi:hypothetical protein
MPLKKLKSTAVNLIAQTYPTGVKLSPKLSPDYPLKRKFNQTRKNTGSCDVGYSAESDSPLWNHL